MTAKDLTLVANEIRVTALRLAAAGDEFSPIDLYRSGVGKSLGVVAYHIRVLHEAGLLRASRTEQRRGAAEHYYQLNSFARSDATKLLAAVDCLFG